MTPSEKKAEEIIEVEWAGECERTGATTFSNHSLTFLKNCIASALDAAERRGFERAKRIVTDQLKGIDACDRTLSEQLILNRLDEDLTHDEA